MNIVFRSCLNRPMLVSSLASALFSGVSLADEPRVEKKQEVVVLVQSVGGDKEKENASQSASDKESVAESPKYWLGIGLKEVTGELAEYLGSDKGVMVASVVPDGPAAKADLRKGDVLVAADGKELEGPSTLLEVLKALPQLKEGESLKPLKISILRKGREMAVELTPVVRPKSVTVKRVEGAIEKALGDKSALLGDLTGKSSEEVKELIEKYALGKKDGASLFRFGLPSTMWMHHGDSAQIQGNIRATIIHDNNGKKVEVTIERTGDEPAKITVKEGDRVKEYAEKQIGDLSPELQQLVRPMLKRGGAIAFSFKGFADKPGKAGDADQSQADSKSDRAEGKQDGSADKRSTENRTERRSRVQIFNSDDFPKWFNEREVGEHVRKMADELAKKYQDSAKWAVDAAAMPKELKELREQVERLHDEVRSLRAQLDASKKGSEGK